MTLFLALLGCGSELAPLPPPEVVVQVSPGDTAAPEVDPTVPSLPLGEQSVSSTVSLVEAPELLDVLAWHCSQIGESPVICSTIGTPKASDLAVVVELALGLPDGAVLQEARVWARVWGAQVGGGACVPLGGEEGCTPPSVDSAELVRSVEPVGRGVFQLTLSGPECIALGGDVVTVALDALITGGVPELVMPVTVWGEVVAEQALFVADELSVTTAFESSD